MPPSSAAVKSPARQQGGQAERSGQQTTGPHAPTANPASCPGPSWRRCCWPAMPPAYHRSPAGPSAPGSGRGQQARSPSRMARQYGDWPASAMSGLLRQQAMNQIDRDCASPAETGQLARFAFPASPACWQGLPHMHDERMAARLSSRWGEFGRHRRSSCPFSHGNLREIVLHCR